MTALATDRWLLSEDDYYSERYPPTATHGSGELADRRQKHVVESGRLRVEVKGRIPAWLKTTVGAVARLLELDPNWDSYGAPPVDSGHAEAILNLLAEILDDNAPSPSVVPTSAGGVQAEWHMAGIDLEIETLSRHRFAFFFEDERTGDEWDEIVTDDRSRLYRSVADLVQRVRSESGC